MWGKEVNMNIQIYGSSKCFDTKKAERYFKERGVKFQSIDLAKFGMSKGEYQSVRQAVGSMEKLVDTEGKDKDMLALMKYLSLEDQEAKLLENPKLFKTPIVRNGKRATVGYQPETWKQWEDK
jgi:arsenate reductase-like glutaredoxin family protein